MRRDLVGVLVTRPAEAPPRCPRVPPSLGCDSPQAGQLDAHFRGSDVEAMIGTEVMDDLLEGRTAKDGR